MTKNTTTTDFDMMLSSIIPERGNLLKVIKIKVEEYGLRLYFQPFTKPVNIIFLDTYEQKDLILSTSLIYHIPKKRDYVFLQTYRTIPFVYADLMQEKGSAKNDEDLTHLIPKIGEPFARIIKEFE